MYINYIYIMPFYELSKFGFPYYVTCLEPGLNDLLSSVAPTFFLKLPRWLTARFLWYKSTISSILYCAIMKKKKIYRIQ